MTTPYIMGITNFELEITLVETKDFIVKQDYPRDIEWVIDEYHDKVDEDGFRIVTIDEVPKILDYINVNKFWVLNGEHYEIYNVKTKKCTDYKTSVEEYKMVTIKMK